MSIDRDSRRFVKLYPRVFLACHTRHVRDPKTRQKVTAQQLRILDHLDDDQGATLGELARHLGVTPSTLSLTIDRLEDKGYVARKRGSGDRRHVLVRLTAAGMRIRGAHSVLDDDRVRTLLQSLSADERAKVVEGLELLAGAASRVMATAQLWTSNGQRPHRKSS